MRALRSLDVPATFAAVAGALVVAALGLQEFAFSDYEAEVLPAAQRLAAGDVSGFLTRLPGYFGAVLLQAPFGLVGGAFPADPDLWTWRFQALPGLLLLAALGAVLGSVVARRVAGTRGTLSGVLTAVMIAGSPFAVRAETVGHPEELLVTGLVLAAVLAGLRERPALAGVLIGLAAVGKPWAVVAVPIVLLAADDRRALVRSAIAMVVAGAVLAVPVLLAHGAGGSAALVPSATGAIFKPGQAFWFFGPENPVARGARVAGEAAYSTATAPYADRLAVAWAARVSHPLVVLVALGLAVAYRGGRPRRARRHPDLLLLLAAVLWWRCVLDTWNADYYALAALVAMAAWSAVRGRLPWLAVAATAAAWCTFRGPWAWWNVTPDAHTAAYLAWAVPLAVGLSWRAVAPESWARLVAVVTPGRRAARVAPAAD